jgi:hypothetical protein
VRSRPDDYERLRGRVTHMRDQTGQAESLHPPGAGIHRGCGAGERQILWEPRAHLARQFLKCNELSHETPRLVVLNIHFVKVRIRICKLNVFAQCPR